ncbi:hypothetical protein FRB98_005280 [Tulasnella sp. 332]|nr:hypothetical protein FRB98_005280 [Tulasnella sp. 332]
MLASGATSIAFLVSTALAGSSTLVSLALCHKHREDILATGPDISKYIMSVENYYHGLRPLSIIFVLPHALTAYAAMSFGIALTSLAVQRSGSLPEAIGFIIAILSAAILPAYAVLVYFDPSLAVTGYIDKIPNPFKWYFQNSRGRGVNTREGEGVSEAKID